MSAFALPGESRPSIICLTINENTLVNSIYPNLYAPTGPLQGLTVMQQCVYQIKFRNVFLMSRSSWYSLYWSGAELFGYCCQ